MNRSELSELLRSDFDKALSMDHAKPRVLRRKLDVLTQAGFLSVVVYRLGHEAHRRGWYPLARLAYLVNVVLFGAEIYPQARIGARFVVAHPVGIAIGAGVVMGADVSVYKGASVGTAGMKDPTKDGFPTIGDRCQLFDGAKLFGPIEVGDNCRIGANTLLMCSIPAGTTVVAPTSEIIEPRASLHHTG